MVSRLSAVVIGLDMTAHAACGQGSVVDHLFAVVGEASPQLALRVLGLFAQQNLLPSNVSLQRTSDRLTMFLVQPALDAHRAAIIAEKMRGIIGVESVEMASTPTAAVMA